MQKIPVGVLAATGSVGQRFIQLLDGHPFFEVKAISGSERGFGKKYGEVARWLLPEAMPAWARELEVLPTDPALINLPIVFSSLPNDIAREAEPAFARAGSLVFTNASAHRMDPTVPILFPEVNPEHLEILPFQRKKHAWSGGIIANSNCTSTGVAVVLKPIADAYGLDKVFAVSLQALSGAGYPGVPSMDIIDNVIPFIGGEEEKVETEPRKILGKIAGDSISLAEFKVSAHTNRVQVTDGHLVCLSIGTNKPAEPAEVEQLLSSYQASELVGSLPSAPKPVILIRHEQNRPQPRLDRLSGNGMTTVVGRIRPDSILDLRLVVLSHNTIRGAAGGSVFNAELAVKMGVVEG